MAAVRTGQAAIKSLPLPPFGGDIDVGIDLDSALRFRLQRYSSAHRRAEQACCIHAGSDTTIICKDTHYSVRQPSRCS